MRVNRIVAGLLVLSLAVSLAGCSYASESQVMIIEAQPGGGTHAPATNVAADDDLSPRVLRRFVALDVAAHAPPSALADLGRKLYYDPRLSKTGKVSCNTCHPLARYGATNERFSKGILGRKGPRNAPSTYHAFGHIAQMWDGRSPSVEKQAIMPIENKDEMGLTAAEAVSIVQRIAGYREDFARGFPPEANAVSIERIGLAIGAFEHGLVTPSRWDRYLRGHLNALTARE